MTAILIGLLGLPFYLAIGYFLGRVTVEEFGDDTCYDKLTLIGKIKRSLIFPIISPQWNKRYDIIGGPGIVSFHDLGDSKISNYYLKFISFFWPFKIFPLIFGIFCCLSALTFYYLEKYCNRLELIMKEVKIKFSASDKGDFNSESVDRLKNFREVEIKERQEKLKETLKEHEKNSQALKLLIQKWAALIEKVANAGQKKRFSAMRLKLAEIAAAKEEEVEQIKRALATILEKSRELDYLIEALELYQEGSDLTVKNHIPLLKDEVQEMILAAKAAMNGIQEAYQVELGMMAKSDFSVEDMAHQIVEAEGKKQEFLAEKAKAEDGCKRALLSAKKCLEA